MDSTDRYVAWAIAGGVVVFFLGALMIAQVEGPPQASKPRYTMTCVADNYDSAAICYVLDTWTGETRRAE